MFEGNFLSVTYRLRDLEHEFAPQLRDCRAERTTPKFYPAATLLVVVIAALTLGTALVI